MNPEEIIYRGQTKDGQEFTLRYPKEKDLNSLLEYINKLSLEQTFILFQGEQFSLKQEEDYLNKQLKNINDKKSVQLLAFVGEELVGNAEINLHPYSSEHHIGSFGITISKDFRDQGIGKHLMEELVHEAKKNLQSLKIITLTCFGDNDIALSMYEKFGFIKFGELPRGLKHQEEYVAHIYMYLEI